MICSKLSVKKSLVTLTALVLLCGLQAAPAQAKDPDRPLVVVTLPTLGAIVHAVGGDAIEVHVLARGDEDPHFVQPTPLLMRKAKDADAFFEMGLRLELWADNVVNGSGNPKIQRGAKARVTLSDGIPTLEVPTRLDAAQGDIHPQGNPHLWLGPVNAKRIARNASEALSRLFPSHHELFGNNLKAFQDKISSALYGPALIKLVGTKRLDRAVLSGRLGSLLSKSFKGKTLMDRAGGWIKKGAPLRGLEVVEYHKVWAYFAAAFGFKIVGTVETYPGIRPGPGHLKDLVAMMKTRKIPIILVDNFYQKDLPEHVAKEAGSNYAMLPDQVGGEPDVKTYVQLMNRVLDEILAKLPSSKSLGAGAGTR